VRYHDKLRYGLEFTALSAEQRNAIRDWAKGVKAEAEPKEDATSVNPKEQKEIEVGKERVRAVASGGPRWSKQKKSGRGWLIAYALIGIVAVVFWWKWNQSWEELESGLKSSEAASAAKPQTQVAAEVMQKLLVHRVEPVYPAEARKQKLQGIIAVNIVVGRDGSVLSMHALNGPDLLAQAAMDALRWWKFEPYRINGEPAIVETTLAVEFKR
jgi:TonB family protein